MKLRKEFISLYPLTQKVVRNLKIVTEDIGILTVTGTAYCDTNYPKTEIDDRYSIDIDYIRWNGTDIKPVVEATSLIDDIIEYMMIQCAEYFDETNASSKAS